MRDCCDQLSPKYRRAAVHHVLECRPFKALAQLVRGVFIPDGPAGQVLHIEDVSDWFLNAYPPFVTTQNASVTAGVSATRLANFRAAQASPHNDRARVAV